MKVLVVSLLRLGDILMHRELAKSLKRQNPGCELHFLIHSQFSSVQCLLPEVDVWHHLERNRIQRVLVERAESPIRAFEILSGLVSALNLQNFDLLLNATHNLFSVRLMDLIQAREKRGAAFNRGRRQPMQNAWQTYFNENFSEEQGSRFHYVQVLHESLGVPVPDPGQAAHHRSPVILLQLLTSDLKKNWGLERFHQLQRKLQDQFPSHRVLGLCSPQEAAKVSRVFSWNEFLSPTLEEAARLLKEACLLITGDTSIQHLAAQQDCPVLSLFLGSADPVKTLPWQTGAYLLQGQSRCFPCRHSEPCHQKTHLCAEALQVESVFKLACGVLNGKAERVLPAGAARTRMNGRYFQADEGTGDLHRTVEQWVWGHYLNGDSKFETGNLRWPESEVVRAETENKVFGELLQSPAAIADIELIEERFKQWKDSLIRLKRNPREGLAEALNLCHIRAQVLKNLRTKQEVQNERQWREQTDRDGCAET